MFNLKEYFESKKTKDLILGAGGITIVCVAVLHYSGGDPAKAAEFFKALREPMAMLSALVGVKIVGQVGIDTMKAAKEKPKTKKSR